MILLYLVGGYLVVGVAFAIPFLTVWIRDVDDASQHAGLTFKLMILPGCVVFWPVLAKKVVDAINNDHK